MNKEEKVSKYLDNFRLEVYSYMHKLLNELNDPSITKEKNSQITMFIVDYIENYFKIIFCFTAINLYSKDSKEIEKIEKEAIDLNLEWQDNLILFENNNTNLLKKNQIEKHSKLITDSNIEKYTNMMNTYKPDTTELDKLREKRKELEEKTKKLKEENKKLQEQLRKSNQKLRKEEQEFLESRETKFKRIDELNAYTDGYISGRDEVIELLEQKEEKELKMLEKESRNFIYRLPVIAWFINHLFNKHKN